MGRNRFTRISSIIVVLGILISGFQNCTPVASPLSTVTTTPSTQMSGNGDGYSGKPNELYRSYNPQQPCTELDREGKPLPNEQIFYQSQTVFGTKEPYIVRQNCVDIKPQLLSSSEVQFDASNNLLFNGQSFSNFMPTQDFQVLAAACPVGKTQIPNAQRTNLIVKSQDWTEQPIYQGWMWHSGIVALLNGSIKSLPAYKIVRNDPNFQEEFRRISQVQKLQANTDYSFSFLAKPDTRDIIVFRYYRVDENGNEEYLIVDFNLRRGTSSVRLNSFLKPATIEMKKVGEGFFCTVHFRTSATANDNFSEFGFSPSQGNYNTQVGDSVFVTAAQLEKTAGFCK